MLRQWKLRAGVLLLGLALMGGLTMVICGQAGPSQDAVTHPYPAGDNGDIWLLGGQSNMNGNGRLEEVHEPDPRILFYANNEGWEIAKDPLANMFFPIGNQHGPAPDYTHLPVGGSGLGLFFANHVIQATNRPLGLIGLQWGKPMTMIWDPTLMDKGEMPPPPYLYGRMIQRVIEAGGYGKLKGMIWYQGESDAVEFPNASAVFEKNLLNFIDRVRRDTGNPNLPIIVVQLARLMTSSVPGLPGTAGGETVSDVFATYTQAWEHVREVQREMAQQRANVYVVASLDLYPMVDPIHLDFGAYQRLGPRIAEVALSEIYKVPGHGTPIQLESIQVDPLPAFKTGEPVHGHSLIRIRFNGVNDKLQAAGRPSGFSLHFPAVGEDVLKKGVPVIYTTEFDPKDPSAVLLRVKGEAAELKGIYKAVLYYGAGLDPYCNIVDGKDMAVPAFGPIELGSPGEKVPAGNAH